MAFNRIAPLIRIFDENKAKEFYVEFLGFRIDFEHRDFDGAPLYMQVSKRRMPFAVNRTSWGL